MKFSPMTSLLTVALLFSLLGCFPTVVVNPAVLMPVPGSSAMPMPDSAGLAVLSRETIARIITRQTLKLQVGEEWMLNGDVQMDSLRVVRFESVAAQLVVENLTPELLALNSEQRLIKALKSGTAQIRIRSLLAEGPSVIVNIVIVSQSSVPSTLDPNVALLELEIE